MILCSVYSFCEPVPKFMKMLASSAKKKAAKDMAKTIQRARRKGCSLTTQMEAIKPTMLPIRKVHPTNRAEPIKRVIMKSMFLSFVIKSSAVSRVDIQFFRFKF